MLPTSGLEEGAFPPPSTDDAPSLDWIASVRGVATYFPSAPGYFW